MKKVSVLALFALLIGSVAMAATNVVSVNVVGYTKVNLSTNKLTIVAVPFNPLSVTNKFTLDELVGTNFSANSELTLADQIYLWNGTGYLRAFLNNGDWMDPALDWKWCYMSGGNAYSCATNPAYSVEVGAAFWFINRTGIPRTLTLLGEVPNSASTATDIPVGLTMMGNPYPVAKTLDELIGIADGATANSELTLADQIYLWNGAGYLRTFMNNGDWMDPALDWKWCYMSGGNAYACATNPAYSVNPGQGFWYINRGTNFVWTESRPYTLE